MPLSENLLELSGNEIEPFEPVGDTAPLFRDALSGDHALELRFFFTDERSTLGHYLEHVWMSPAMLAQIDAVIPTYPPAGPVAPT